MTQELLRVILTGIFTLLLAQQAMRAVRGTRRRQAFVFGALGFALLTMANLLILLQIGEAWMLLVSMALGLALLVAAIVAIVVAYRSGEMEGQVRQARALLDEERRRRERGEE